MKKQKRDNEDARQFIDNTIEALLNLSAADQNVVIKDFVTIIQDKRRMTIQQTQDYKNYLNSFFDELKRI